MPDNSQSPILRLFALAIPVLFALFVRTAPLLEGGDRLRHQCITEDGYLMLTIARNIALGHGFAIADGQIATNGTQPLTTLLFAACIYVAGGDRLLGLYPVVALQVLWSIAGAIALSLCTRRYLYRGPNANAVALIAAALWFISPTSLYHTQNGLETGLYALFILVSISAYDAAGPRLRQSVAFFPCAGLGVLLGITFLARNDACFLIAAMLLFHFLTVPHRAACKRAFGQCLIIGSASIVVASPWLWFNLTKFGHLIPVSGRAETYNVTFAQNLWPAFVSFCENATLVLRIPGWLENQPWISLSCLILLVFGLGLLWRCRDWLRESFSPGVAVLALFVACLFVYYALFFGMPQFLGRYLFPVTILSALLLAAAVANFSSRMRAHGEVSASADLSAVRSTIKSPFTKRSMAITILLLLPCIAFDARIYHNGRKHLHSQVVEWVQTNVSDDIWVGATQTGTLGYYHDRTINLDGKVNPIALEYRRQHRIAEYAYQSNVQYIVDWVGHAAWAKLPEFSPFYELLVEDHAKNLAVLRRKENSDRTLSSSR